MKKTNGISHGTRYRNRTTKKYYFIENRFFPGMGVIFVGAKFEILVFGGDFTLNFSRFVSSFVFDRANIALQRMMPVSFANLTYLCFIVGMATNSIVHLLLTSSLIASNIIVIVVDLDKFLC